MNNRRVIDRMLTPEAASRVAATRAAKVFGNYFDGDGHVCRFCKQVLKNQDGKPNSSFRMVEVAYENNGGYHRFNCCANCADSFNQHDAALLEAVYCCDLEAWAREHEKAGVSPEVSQLALAERVKAKLAPGLKVVLFPGKDF